MQLASAQDMIMEAGATGGTSFYAVQTETPTTNTDPHQSTSMDRVAPTTCASNCSQPELYSQMQEVIQQLKELQAKSEQKAETVVTASTTPQVMSHQVQASYVPPPQNPQNLHDSAFLTRQDVERMTREAMDRQSHADLVLQKKIQDELKTHPHSAAAFNSFSGVPLGQLAFLPPNIASSPGGLQQYASTPPTAPQEFQANQATNGFRGQGQGQGRGRGGGRGRGRPVGPGDLAPFKKYMDIAKATKDYPCPTHPPGRHQHYECLKLLREMRDQDPEYQGSQQNNQTTQSSN